jgi:hypothetical protein
MIDSFIVNVTEEAEAITDTSKVSVVEAARTNKMKVDGNTLRNVHLVGFSTKNYVKPSKQPYAYTQEALSNAVALYENADIYVGHTKTPTVGLRDPSEKIGFATGIKYDAKEGLFGDITLNEKHPAYESFIWWAQHKPEKLMMSHEAQCTYNPKLNAMTEIHKVDCVAFVSEGSTTKGLFKEGVIADKIADEKMLNIVMDTFWSITHEIQYPLGKTLTMTERAVQLVPVVKDLLEELSKLVPSTKDASEANTEAVKVTPTKESTMEFKDITLDELSKQRKDLVDAIATKAVEAHIHTEEAVTEALSEIPVEHQSDLFKTQVREAVVAGNDKLVAQIVADRKVLVEKATTKVVEAPTVRPQKKQETKPLDKASVVALAKKHN